MESINPYQTIASIRSMPGLPAVLTQVMETVQDPEASALDLSQFIASDQTLAAALLRVVNSAYYGFYREVSSVTTAIVILGFLEVRNLVLAVTAYNTLSSSRAARGLWRHSLEVAIGAQRTARLMSVPPAAGPFVAGLLHDVGKVVLQDLYPEAYRLAAQQSWDRAEPVCVGERDVFQLDHAEAGAILAEHWNLPEPIVEAIRYHHEPSHAPKALKLTNLTAYADYLAYEAGGGDPCNGAAPSVPMEAARKLDLSDRQFAQLKLDMSDAAERIDELLGAIHGD
ncbi:MAG: HDOD domain-containing protein [Candidatus Hydrogenedentota bacterium]